MEQYIYAETELSHLFSVDEKTFCSCAKKKGARHAAHLFISKLAFSSTLEYQQWISFNLVQEEVTKGSFMEGSELEMLLLKMVAFLPSCANTITGIFIAAPQARTVLICWH